MQRRGRLALPMAGLLALSGVQGCATAQRSLLPLLVNPPAEGAGCRVYAAPVVTGAMPSALHESSGLVASRRHPGLFWSHNDSGNAFELFLLTPSGEIRARYPVASSSPVDLEAIALGPCTRGSTESCLFVADVGDNLLLRQERTIFRLREPELPEASTLSAEALSFRLSVLPRNMEALFSDPRTAQLYLITKRAGSLGEVFRIDGLDEPGGGRAVEIGKLHDPEFGPGDSVGAADLHPGGERLLIRTYARLYELRAPGARSVEQLVREGTLVQLPSHPQRQSEAAAYFRDGRSLLIGSEGEGSPLFEVRCAQTNESPAQTTPDPIP